MHDELMCAVWKGPTVLLHQGDKGETKQLLLALLLRCGGKEKEKTTYLLV